MKIGGKKRKLGLGIILSQNVGYELNDCPYNFLIDNMFLKNYFIGSSKSCFVRRNIQRLPLCFSPARSDSISQTPEEVSGRLKPTRYIYPRTSRITPGAKRWLKPISSADQTHPTTWSQVRTTILAADRTTLNLSHATHKLVPSASFSILSVLQSPPHL